MTKQEIQMIEQILLGDLIIAMDKHIQTLRDRQMFAAKDMRNFADNHIFDYEKLFPSIDESEEQS